jgi:hypothetical protein
MRIAQVVEETGKRIAVVTTKDGTFRIKEVTSTYELVARAFLDRRKLKATIKALGLGKEVDLAAALAERRVLPPIDHPDQAHMHLTGTGLTHLGSAEGRDQMHKAAAAGETDSMRMFKLGLEGGKPAGGGPGVQPEWFYKGDGSIVTAPEHALVSPSFALDGGEEPEIVGIYVNSPNGHPTRVGFALGNEFSDHVTERQNYLYLAHSKLRPASFGPEILLGSLPADVRGLSRIRRDGAVLWEKPFLSGEANMSHSIASLEAHHFKYAQFRRPGDLHIHFFGTATLSFSDGIRTQPGDVCEIEAEGFGMPLRNPLVVAPGSWPADAPAMKVL